MRCSFEVCRTFIRASPARELRREPFLKRFPSFWCAMHVCYLQGASPERALTARNR